MLSVGFAQEAFEFFRFSNWECHIANSFIMTCSGESEVGAFVRRHC